jgi:hypothetical protein
MVEIKLTPAGVPVLIDGEQAIALTHEQQGWVQALCMENPDLLDRLERAIRVGVEAVSGIDADQDMSEWWVEFQNALTINQFTTPLDVLSRTRAMTTEWAHE